LPSGVSVSSHESIFVVVMTGPVAKSGAGAGIAARVVVVVTAGVFEPRVVRAVSAFAPSASGAICPASIM
jgi:hypothetical protein